MGNIRSHFKKFMERVQRRKAREEKKGKKRNILSFIIMYAPEMLKHT